MGKKQKRIDQRARGGGGGGVTRLLRSVLRRGGGGGGKSTFPLQTKSNSITADGFHFISISFTEIRFRGVVRSARASSSSLTLLQLSLLLLLLLLLCPVHQLVTQPLKSKPGCIDHTHTHFGWDSIEFPDYFPDDGWMERAEHSIEHQISIRNCPLEIVAGAGI